MASCEPRLTEETGESPLPGDWHGGVRREALRHITCAGGRNLEGYSWVDALPGAERLRGQRHGAPRGASPYSLCSREELGGMFLGLMSYLAPKG
jgi:hypothetical protein